MRSQPIVSRFFGDTLDFVLDIVLDLVLDVVLDLVLEAVFEAVLNVVSDVVLDVVVGLTKGGRCMFPLPEHCRVKLCLVVVSFVR